MKHTIDPDGARLPIQLDSTSNGEFVPVPLSETYRAANRLAHAAASHNAYREQPAPHCLTHALRIFNLLNWTGGSRL